LERENTSLKEKLENYNDMVDEKERNEQIDKDRREENTRLYSEREAYVLEARNHRKERDDLLLEVANL